VWPPWRGSRIRRRRDSYHELRTSHEEHLAHPKQLSKLYDSGGQSGWSIHGVVCSGLSLTIYRVGSSVEVVVNQDADCLWLSWLESRSHCTSTKDFRLSRWRAVGGSPSAIVQTQRAAVAQARGEQKEDGPHRLAP
jgi:hypothetical protein